jgi:hypothetical protein
MAKRRFLPDQSRDAVPVDLIDGGTIGIRPMSFDAANRYGEIVARTDFVRDEKGAIVYNQKSGAPERRWIDTTAEEIEFVARDLVAYVRNLELEDKTPFELSGEIESDRPKIIAFLKELNTSEIPLDSDGKEFIGAPGQIRGTGEKATLRALEPIYRLVLRESARIRREQNELLRKNS